jgi:hypothetical protein
MPTTSLGDPTNDRVSSGTGVTLTVWTPHFRLASLHASALLSALVSFFATLFTNNFDLTKLWNSVTDLGEV